MTQYFIDKLNLFCTKVSFDTSEENQLSYFQNSFEVSWATLSNKMQLKNKTFFEVLNKQTNDLKSVTCFGSPVFRPFYSQTSAGNFFLTETRKCWHLHLTPNTWAIRLSLTQSKWNMNEICGLKFHLSYATRIILEIPPCAHHF